MALKLSRAADTAFLRCVSPPPSSLSKAVANSSCCSLYANAASSSDDGGFAEPTLLVATSCEAWTKLLPPVLPVMPLVSCGTKLPVLLVVVLLLMPCVVKLLLLALLLILVLVLSCVVMELTLPPVFLLLLKSLCTKLVLLLGGFCFFTSSLLAEHDAVELLLASTSLGNKSWMVFQSTVLIV